jgi:hypothetical protein
MDVTGSVSCPLAGFGNCGVETSDSPYQTHDYLETTEYTEKCRVDLVASTINNV